MFLICNGILAILAKSSVSSSKTSAFYERELSSEPTLSSAIAEATVDDQEVHAASVEPLEDIVLATEEEEEEEETASSEALVSEEEDFIEENTECMVKQEEDEGDEELTSTEETEQEI
ncbi:hypothetical protein OIU77_018250 [Salix suchowensis]|uniref:Uncharacterized protein n=1 Tax=Salix suchowensis TaxID=1278906 RepID=A0ABQ8ZRY2_9ROSI|nr:hypothetical protein OIU77_018250 [Salix suchowensis]